MKILETVKKELEGKEIKGKDGKIYKISVVGESATFTIWVTKKEESNLRGFLEEIRVFGREFYLSIMADFTRISGRGLYGETMKLLSGVMPSGMSFRSELANLQDREHLLNYIEEKKRKKEEILEKEAVSNTLFGHVLLSSFRRVVIEYEHDGFKISGVKALEEFGSDQRNNKKHKGYLYFIGKK